MDIIVEKEAEEYIQGIEYCIAEPSADVAGFYQLEDGSWLAFKGDFDIERLDSMCEALNWVLKRNP